MEYKAEYEDICKAGFQGTYEDYLEYRISYDKTEISDDMKSVGLIVNTLCDVLSERLGFDVKAELSKRIDEVETED